MKKEIICCKKSNQIFIEGHWYYLEQSDISNGIAIDLTYIFGEGNEPKDINDKKIDSIKYKPYINYNEGIKINEYESK